MCVEITIERTKKLPDGTMSALESELLKRLNNQFSCCKITVPRAATGSLSVMGGDKEQKKLLMRFFRRPGKAMMTGFTNCVLLQPGFSETTSNLPCPAADF